MATMIGCLPTQALAFLAVFVYATQAIEFKWKLGLTVCCAARAVHKALCHGDFCNKHPTNCTVTDSHTVAFGPGSGTSYNKQSAVKHGHGQLTKLIN